MNEPAGAIAALPPCPNCGEPLSPHRGATPRYCAACGQETSVQAPTLREFAQQFGGAYLSTEGALWRTLKLLLTRPGELTRQYLAGRRKHYVLPLRLYLTISVLVLLVLRLVASQALNAPGTVRMDKADETTNLVLQLGAGRLGLREGRYFCEGLPAWVCERARGRFDLDPRVLHETVVGVGERLTGNLGAAMFLLLPAFAAALMVVYWNRRMRYTEHLVFALHVHAFWFVMLALTLPGWGPLTFAALLAVPVYTVRAMQRVYGGRLPWRLLRACVVSTAYLAVMLMVLSALSVWALLA